jgi:hypothetical protein
MAISSLAATNTTEYREVWDESMGLAIAQKVGARRVLVYMSTMAQSLSSMRS